MTKTKDIAIGALVVLAVALLAVIARLKMEETKFMASCIPLDLSKNNIELWDKKTGKAYGYDPVSNITVPEGISPVPSLVSCPGAPSTYGLE